MIDCEPPHGAEGPRFRLAQAVFFVAVGWTALSEAACSDPYASDWYAVQDTAVLYSTESPQRNVHNAFDFANGLPVVLEDAEATGTWDVAVGSDLDGFVLVPPGALGVASEAGIAEFIGVRFEDVGSAPEDSASFVKLAPVPLRLGNTYVIRTRTTTDYYGTTTCNFYAKMSPTSVDLGEFRVRFMYTINPNCYDRRLTP